MQNDVFYYPKSQPRINNSEFMPNMKVIQSFHSESNRPEASSSACWDLPRERREAPLLLCRCWSPRSGDTSCTQLVYNIVYCKLVALAEKEQKLKATVKIFFKNHVMKGGTQL